MAPSPPVRLTAPGLVNAAIEDPSKELPSLSETLFHRLLRGGFPIHFLNVQHRMHPALSKFPSEAYYDGNLLDGVSAADRPLPAFPWPDRNRPVCFINVDGPEAFVETSYCNVAQAKVVLTVVEALLLGGLSSSDAAVIVPYAAQAREIRAMLGDIRCEVSSIDAFQGRETEVIIFCTVRAREQLGFVDSSHRMNVLLTRARRGIVGIGHIDTMRLSTLWERWIGQAPILTASKLSAWRPTPKSKGHKKGEDNRGKCDSGDSMQQSRKTQVAGRSVK